MRAASEAGRPIGRRGPDRVSLRAGSRRLAARPFAFRAFLPGLRAGPGWPCGPLAEATRLLPHPASTLSGSSIAQQW